ncbi:MAG: hypothetical protein U0325_27715 [Polyangiales bacterium]
MGVATLAAAFATARGARAGADTRARQELVAIPRALSMTWGVLAAVRFAEGALSPAGDARGALSLAASAMMAMAAVAMHPALRHAVRPALDDARASTACPRRRGSASRCAPPWPSASPAARRPCSRCWPSGRRACTSRARRRNARRRPVRPGLAACRGRRARRRPFALAARAVLTVVSGALGAALDKARPRARLPSRGWTVAVALAAGALGALIGRRVGRDAARTLTLAAARIDALSSGERTSAATSATPSTDAVPEVDALRAQPRRPGRLALVDDQRSGARALGPT